MMFETDVEFFRTERTGQDRLKSAIWSDAEFEGFVAEVGLEDALYDVSDFHANVASQLKAQGISSPRDSEWAGRTIGLCQRLKSRRQQLRKALRESREDGADLVAEIAAEIKADWSD